MHAQAMTALHQMEILHRDLATRNVLVHSVDGDNISQVWVKVVIPVVCLCCLLPVRETWHRFCL